MKFGKCSKTEEWLRGMGIDFHYEDIPSTSIDRKKSRQNKARQRGAIIEEHVFKLGYDAENGSVFPPVIAAKEGSLYRLLDGNHRDEANQVNGAGPVGAIVVETEDDVLKEIITRFANRDLNGVGQDKDEAMEHALYLYNTYGYPLKRVAKIAGVKLSTLQTHKATEETRKELMKQKVPADKLSGTVVRQLGRLKNNVRVMVAAADVADRHNLSEKDTKWMTNCVLRSPKTEDEQLKAVEKFEKEHLREPELRALVADKHVRAGRSLKGMLTRLLQHLEKYPTGEANAINDPTSKELLTRDIDSVIAKLTAIKKTVKV